jgi:SpoVK/Ycf46/Vps4 family AAA+-type ATPase
MYELMSMRAMEDGIVEPHEVAAFQLADVPSTLESGTVIPEIDEVLAELDALVGLEPVKQRIRSLIDRVRVRAAADEHGLPTFDFNLNLVFGGEPGTGKTTVARIVARAYQALGVLPRGQLIETGREELVSGYVGQTATKTKDKIDEASGGVLFIDEAYALSGENDRAGAGKEAVNVLVQEMENRRNEFAVIAAGYRQDMEFFLDSNQGLKSRFDEQIVFPNFSKEEMLQIFMKTTNEMKIAASEDVIQAVQKHLQNNQTGGAEGNGRYIRKLFDKMHQNLAARAAKENFSLEVLSSFVASDVPDKISESMHRPIGF